jgi:uncharacterized protein YabE (DUF348 family)
MNETGAQSRFTPLLLLLILGGMLSLGLAAYFLGQETYTVYDGSRAIPINGRFATVDDVLQAAEITLRPEDLVQPPRGAPPQPAIQVQRAQEITLTQDGRVRTYWTRQPTVAAFLAEARVPITQRQELSDGANVLDLSILDQTPLPTQLIIRPQLLSVTVQDGEQPQTFFTSAATVSELLDEADVVLDSSESVAPPADTPLVEGMTIQVQRTIPVTVAVDGGTTAVRSAAADPTSILAAAGVTLGELDYTLPSLDTSLQAGDTLRVVRVREELLTVDEALPYQTVYQPSADLDLDTKAQLSPGTPGLKQRVTRVRYEDGQEVSRVDEGEIVAQEPVNEVIGYGTRIVTNFVDTPDGPREYWRVVRMRATAYTAASSGKAPDHPNYGITASGRPAGTGIVAVDPNVVPFRSEVFIPGYGVGFAGDTGGGVKGRWIDLGFDEDELETWNGYADVYYLTPIPAEINYLLPEVLP